MRPASLTLRALGLLGLSLSLGLGCAGLKPADTPAGLSPLAQSCTDSPADAENELERLKLCVKAFDEAAARHDARSAGQALLIWSRYQDASVRGPWLKLSMWLNPQPWLPKNSGWSAKALEAHQVERLSLGDAQALRFEGSKPLQGVKTLLAPIKLPTLQPIEALPIKLAAAIGAPAVLDDERLFAATPMLGALTRASSSLDITDITRAKALAKADHALAAGDALLASATLLAALEDSDESVQPCGALAMARYTLYILGPSIFISGHKSYLDEIATRCASKTTDKNKSAIEDPYWSAITALEQGKERALLTTLKQAEGIDTYLTSLPRGLSPSQRQWIELLAKKLKFIDASFNHSDKDRCAPDARPDAAAADALLKELQRADRHDLAQRLYVSASIVGKTDQELKLSDTLAALNVFEQQPMPAWQRSAGVQALLSALQMKLSPLDRVKLQPHCLSYTLEIKTQATKDQGLGASQRAAERLLEQTRHQSLCGASKLRPLAEQTLDALMRGEQGRLNIAKLLAQLSVESIQMILQGKMDSIFQIMSAMAPKLENIEQGLSESPADLVLSSLLGVTRQLAQQVQPPELLLQLERALTQLDRALKTAPSPQDDAILQYAPALRLLFQHMLLTTRIAFGTGDPKVEIARIEETLEQDLRGVMRLLDQEMTLASVIAAHLRVVYSTSILAAAPSAAALSQELQKMELLPEIKATKWWPLGLMSAQLGLLSAQVWIANTLNEDDLRQRALLSASKVLEHMITRGLDEFEGKGSNWALLKLLVPAYELGVRYLIAPEDTASTLKLMMQRLPELERAAKLIMSDLETHTRAQTSAPNFVDLFVDLLKVTLKVGVLNIYDPVNEQLSAVTRVKLASELEQTITRYSPKLQVYLYTMIAFLKVDDIKGSMRALMTASELGKGTSEAYLPALLALRLHGQGWTKPKETLELMTQVGQMTKAAAQCQAQPPLISLYPQHARLIDINNLTQRASSLREQYLKSVHDQEAGEVTLSCQVNASKGYVKATFNLTFPTSTLGFPAESEQETKADNEHSTFQVGLGVSAVLEDSEELKCSLQRDPVTQLARTYQVYLDQALVGLWRQDRSHDTTRALRALLSLHHRLLYTQPHAMQRDGAQLNHAAQRIDLAQLSWVSALAQLRGYWQVARLLNESYLLLRPRSTRTPAQLSETPKFVMALDGLSELKPLVAALAPDAQTQPSTKEVNAIWSKIKNKPSNMTAINLTLLNLSVASRQGDMDTAKQLWAQIKAHQGDPMLFSHLKKSMAIWMEPELREPQKIDAALLEVLLEGTGLFNAEGWPLLQAFAPKLSTESLIKLAEAKLLFPPDLMRLVADELIKRLDQSSTPEVALALWLEHSAAFTDATSLTNMHYGYIKLLASHKQWAQAAKATSALNIKVAELLPLNHPTLIELLTLQLAMSGLAGEELEATLSAMNLWVESIPEISDQLKATIKLWADHRSEPAKLKAFMTAYVQTLFTETR